jgi:hypothetical protein
MIAPGRVHGKSLILASIAGETGKIADYRSRTR